MCCKFVSSYVCFMQAINYYVLLELRHFIYHIAQNFDGENIDGFDAQLAIHQNFPFQLYSKYRLFKR